MFIVWGWGFCFAHRKIHIVGTCAKCNRNGALACYEAIHFFKLYWIPIIPLGRKRVLRACPHCRHCAMISLAKYRSIVRMDLEPAINTLLDRPSDRQTAIRALAICVELCDKERFERAAAAVSRAQKSDHEIVTLIAAGYNLFGENALAEQTIAAAISANDTPEVRKCAMRHYIAMGDLSQAASHVVRLLDLEGEAASDTVLLLGRLMQLRGLHSEAVRLVDESLRRYPTARTEEIAYLRRQSELKPDRPDKAAAGRFQMTQPKSGVTRGLLVPALLALAFCVYVCLCAFMPPRHTYLVNGTDEAYYVRVNGEPIRMAPKRETRMPAVFGATRISAGSGAPSFVPIELRIESGFWRRPFYDGVHVVNPDGLAPIVWEEVGYVARNAMTTLNQPKLSAQYYAGQTQYEFHDVDYPFSVPPNEIELNRSKVSTETRSHVFANFDLTVPQIVHALMDTQGAKPTGAYLRRILTNHSFPVNYWILALATTPAEDFQATLEARCLVRPVDVHAHLMLQYVMRTRSPEVDAADHYARLLAAEPDNRDLAYLLSRVTDDPDRSLELLIKSVQKPNPCPFGHAGLARRLLCEGRFNEALDHARTAEREVDDVDAKVLIDKALMALGAIGELETHLRTRAFGAIIDDDAIVELVRVIATHDREQAVQELTEAKRKATLAWNVPYSHPAIQRIYDRSSLAISESTGPRDAYIRLLKASRSAEQRLEAAMLEHDYAAMNQILADTTDELRAEPMTNAIGYILAMRAQRPDIASEFMSVFSANCENGEAQSRRIARWINAETPPAAETLAVSIEPGPTGAIICCAFAERFPEASKAFLALARRNNYGIGFPRHLLDDLLTSGE
ncbi:MAG TPA: hypothetical protein P5081_15190 [Phycisphaerae bacterium]|nr:hypothetical protein [Phycisphaerae bacterium]HRW54215.1 hypothetical protein [Phycisphaerae bacterium]